MPEKTQSYVIEVGSDQVGLVIKEPGERDFTFHSALGAYNPLEGLRFADPLQAERAALAHARGRRKLHEARPDGVRRAA